MEEDAIQQKAEFKLLSSHSRIHIPYKYHAWKPQAVFNTYEVCNKPSAVSYVTLRSAWLMLHAEYHTIKARQLENKVAKL
jgi:hypothetical protein